MLVWTIHHAEMLVTDRASRPWRYGMLADALRVKGHRVVQWAPTFSHYTRTFRALSDAVLIAGEGHEIQLIHAGGYGNNVSLRRILFVIRFARRLLEVARRRERPDVIVTAMPAPQQSLMVMRLARELGIPFLIDVRDLWPDAIQDLSPRALRAAVKALLLPMKATNRRIFGACTGAIAISEAYLNWALEYAGRARRDADGVFPIGYQAPRISEERRAAAKAAWGKRGVTGESFTCCYFGTMSRQYWLEDVIRAARMLPETSFVLCGDGDSRARYVELAKDLGNVSFPGWISPEEVDALMSLSDVGLAPYRGGAQMSLPNKPFEYMAGGLPVVSSLEGELKNLLEGHRCGLTYRAGAPDDLAGCLRKLRDDADVTAAMSANARRLYETSFRADRIYAALTLHLESVVERARGPQSAVAPPKVALTPL
jgi:glycosyltransferase involved in cell wall biosynthesis